MSPSPSSEALPGSGTAFGGPGITEIPTLPFALAPAVLALLLGIVGRRRLVERTKAP
jgi:hypothetical protein